MLTRQSRSSKVSLMDVVNQTVFLLEERPQRFQMFMRKVSTSLWHYSRQGQKRCLDKWKEHHGWRPDHWVGIKWCPFERIFPGPQMEFLSARPSWPPLLSM